MATDLTICNSTMIKLGNEVIGSLLDQNKRAKLCNAQYLIIKKKMLYSHPWNFATKKVALLREVFTFLDADVIVAANTITETAHGKATGDKVRLTTAGALPTPFAVDTTYHVIVIDNNTIKLALNATDAIEGTNIVITAAAGGGIHTAAAVPVFGFSYQFLLPSDYLRGLEFKSESRKWQVEGNRILTNDSIIYLKYIADIDEAIFTDAFAEVVAYALAVEICYSLVQSSAYKETLRKELREALALARSFDAQEGTPPEFTDNSYVTERL